MPKTVKPFLRPKIILTYPKYLGKLTRAVVYSSYSRWQEILYPKVISRTPISKSTDDRQTKGLLRSHIKLVTFYGGEKGLTYKTIAVPGAGARGSPAYHALMAIYAYHADSGRPLTIKPKTGSVLTFPLTRGQVFRNPQTARTAPGGRGPKRWVVTKKVFQRKWAKTNPWIGDIFRENKGMLVKILHENMIATRRKKRETRIAIG